MEAHGETRPRKRPNRKLRGEQQRNAEPQERENSSRHSRDEEEIKLRHSFSEEEADDGASLLYKILFFVLLLVLGGLATIVLIDNNNSLISSRECVDGESCSVAEPDHVPVQVDGEEEQGAVGSDSWFDWLTQEEQDHDHHHVEEFTDEPHEFHDDHDDDDVEHHHGGAGSDGPKQRGPEGIAIPSAQHDGEQVPETGIEQAEEDRLPGEEVFVNSLKNDNAERAPVQADNVEAGEEEEQDQQAEQGREATNIFQDSSAAQDVTADFGETGEEEEEQVVPDFAEAFSDNDGEGFGESNQGNAREEPAADFYAREQIDNTEEEEDNGEIDENDLGAEFLRNIERVAAGEDGFGGQEEDDIFDDAHEYM